MSQKDMLLKEKHMKSYGKVYNNLFLYHKTETKFKFSLEELKLLFFTLSENGYFYKYDQKGMFNQTDLCKIIHLLCGFKSEQIRQCEPVNAKQTLRLKLLEIAEKLKE